MSDQMIIDHCSPTLDGLKTGNKIEANRLKCEWGIKFRRQILESGPVGEISS